jgi:hypothetical protein
MARTVNGAIFRFQIVSSIAVVLAAQTASVVEVLRRYSYLNEVGTIPVHYDSRVGQKDAYSSSHFRDS